MEKISIPKRSRQCMPDVLDLTEKYNTALNDISGNGAALFKMPKCLDLYARIAYDARGAIRLCDEMDGGKLPDCVGDILVGWKCNKVHFLQGALGEAEEGQVIGEYVLRYENGQSHSVPIIYGRNVKDIAFNRGDTVPVDAEVAWSDNEDICSGINVQIYSYSINNPLPDVSLASIDFVSSQTASAPLLLAVTAQPVETVYDGFFDGFKAVNTIYPRDRWASDDLIDLTDYYNASLDDDWHKHEGHDLQNVPKGLQSFGGATFDVRGIIQLAAGNISLRRTGAVYPESVSGIKVNRYAKKMHFLHSCGWSTESGVKVGEYVIHYASQMIRRIPLVYGENIADWWLNHPVDYNENTQIAWRGYNSYCHNMGVEVHLMKFCWKNPMADEKIESIDFISCLETAGPFLVAITTES